MLCRCHKFQFCTSPPSHLKWSFLVAPLAWLQERGTPFIGFHSIWGLPNCTATLGRLLWHRNQKGSPTFPLLWTHFAWGISSSQPQLLWIGSAPRKGLPFMQSFAPFPLDRRQETSGFSQDCSFKASTWAAFHQLESGLSSLSLLQSSSPPGPSHGV